MQVVIRLPSYLSNATGLNKFPQVCSELLISLARCISREESIRDSREQNTTSSLRCLLLLLLGRVDRHGRREENYMIELYFWYDFT